MPENVSVFAYMIVFIAGMPRSGSTFAFNVARDTLNRRGSVYQEAALPDILPDLSRAGDVQHVLLKVHQLDQFGISLGRFGAARVVCTIRNPEDAAASWIESFGYSEDEAISTMRAYLGLYKHLRPFALTVGYRTIDQHPFKAARQIMRFLVPNVTIPEIWHIARQHRKAEVKKRTDKLSLSDPGVKDLDFSYYDEKTFFHRRHVSSLKSRSALERLPSEQVQRIRAALAEETAAAGIKSLL